MDESSEPVRFVDDTDTRRFELSRGDALVGFATYTNEPGTITIVHTEVFPEFQHRGNASELVRLALDDIRRRGLHVVPRCEFAARFVHEHPEYADLVRAG